VDNGDVTFRLGGGAASGIDHYTDGDGEEIANPYTVTASVTYTFRSVSTAGNISALATYEVNIDRSTPETGLALKEVAENGEPAHYSTSDGADIFTITPGTAGSGASAITTYTEWTAAQRL
jgi:hypothetical protein